MAKTKKAGKQSSKQSAKPARSSKPAKSSSKGKPATKANAKAKAPPVKAAGKPAKAAPVKAPAKPVAAPTAAKVPPKKDGKKAAAAPTPAPLPILPKVEAPPKFRREYKRWKDVLISLRHRLLKEGSNLEEEGLKALEQEVSVDHMADFGSDSSEQETTLQLIESNSLSLRDVDDALKRIDAKSYGLCEECEQLIPSARLGILPHARFCIACQEKREGMPA